MAPPVDLENPPKYSWGVWGEWLHSTQFRRFNRLPEPRLPNPRLYEWAYTLVTVARCEPTLMLAAVLPNGGCTSNAIRASG
jgi:hypothetical protein